MQLFHFAVKQKLTQHCKVTILQQRITMKKKEVNSPCFLEESQSMECVSLWPLYQTAWRSPGIFLLLSKQLIPWFPHSYWFAFCTPFKICLLKMSSLYARPQNPGHLAKEGDAGLPPLQLPQSLTLVHLMRLAQPLSSLLLELTAIQSKMERPQPHNSKTTGLCVCVPGWLLT